MPDELKELWRSVEKNGLLTEKFTREQERLLNEYRKIWTDALTLEGFKDLPASLFHELGLYTQCADAAEIQLRCSRAVKSLAQEWREKVNPTDSKSVERFYNESQVEIYDLIAWHTLSDDLSPLAYVTAVQFGLRQGCRSCLDFGSGIGAGSLLFVQHGFKVGLADISSPLLAFGRWRFQLRQLCADF